MASAFRARPRSPWEHCAPNQAHEYPIHPAPGPDSCCGVEATNNHSTRRKEVATTMQAEHATGTDAMELRAMAQQYTGPSASRIASLIAQPVSFERGWFRTTTAVCHGGDDPNGLAFRQRPDGNGIDVRCHTGGCTRAHVVTTIEGLIGLPIWTAYEPVSEPTARSPPQAVKRWVKRQARPGLARSGAACWRLPLLLGHGVETAVAKRRAHSALSEMLLTGLPGRARRAFRS